MALGSLYVLPTEARVQSLAADTPFWGRIFPTRHYIPRGGKAIAPEAWVCCEATEACTAAPYRQHCREQSKPKPSKTRVVGTVDTGIETTMLDAGRVPLARATTTPRVPRRERSTNCAYDRERGLLD